MNPDRENRSRPDDKAAPSGRGPIRARSEPLELPRWSKAVLGAMLLVVAFLLGALTVAFSPSRWLVSSERDGLWAQCGMATESALEEGDRVDLAGGSWIVSKEPVAEFTAEFFCSPDTSALAADATESAEDSGAAAGTGGASEPEAKAVEPVPLSATIMRVSAWPARPQSNDYAASLMVHYNQATTARPETWHVALAQRKGLNSSGGTPVALTRLPSPVRVYAHRTDSGEVAFSVDGTSITWAIPAQGVSVVLGGGAGQQDIKMEVRVTDGQPARVRMGPSLWPMYVITAVLIMGGLLLLNCWWNERARATEAGVAAQRAVRCLRDAGQKLGYAPYGSTRSEAFTEEMVEELGKVVVAGVQRPSTRSTTEPAVPGTWAPEVDLTSLADDIKKAARDAAAEGMREMTAEARESNQAAVQPIIDKLDMLLRQWREDLRQARTASPALPQLHQMRLDSGEARETWIAGVGQALHSARNQSLDMGWALQEHVRSWIVRRHDLADRIVKLWDRLAQDGMSARTIIANFTAIERYVYRPDEVPSPDELLKDLPEDNRIFAQLSTSLNTADQAIRDARTALRNELEGQGVQPIYFDPGTPVSGLGEKAVVTSDWPIPKRPQDARTVCETVRLGLMIGGRVERQAIVRAYRTWQEDRDAGDERPPGEGQDRGEPPPEERPAARDEERLGVDAKQAPAEETAEQTEQAAIREREEEKREEPGVLTEPHTGAGQILFDLDEAGGDVKGGDTRGDAGPLDERDRREEEEADRGSTRTKVDRSQELDWLTGGRGRDKGPRE